MKRRNVQMAFLGEGAGMDTDAPSKMAEGDEAVDVKVTGGKLMVVVPTGTPDKSIFDEASILGGELLLENGLRFTFEIQEDAEGALFSTAKAGAQVDTHPGLSTLPNVPGGT